MTAAEITFGIEIECFIPAENAPVVGAYHRGWQIAGLPQGWNAQSDGSIQPESGYVGVEVVSPILKGADGVRQIKAVCEWLKQVGAKVNKSTGFHVHVGFDRQNEEQMAKLVTVVANFEKAIYASSGTKNREQGHYCQSVQNSILHKNGQLNRVSRYHVLNVMTGKPTVEFRAFAGTISFTKIVAHVRTCLGIVEKTLKIKRLPKWTAKTPIETSPIHRGGEGETALTRLFYWLGWTKGREDYTFGLEGEEGPSIEECKKELVRLARKYDER
jgi:Putative amidoligase enzyme